MKITTIYEREAPPRFTFEQGEIEVAGEGHGYVEVLVEWVNGKGVARLIAYDMDGITTHELLELLNAVRTPEGT